MLISVIFDNLMLDVIAMICLRQTVELNWNPLSTIAPSVISELTTKLPSHVCQICWSTVSVTKRKRALHFVTFQLISTYICNTIFRKNLQSWSCNLMFNSSKCWQFNISINFKHLGPSYDTYMLTKQCIKVIRSLCTTLSSGLPVPVIYVVISEVVAASQCNKLEPN